MQILGIDNGLDGGLAILDAAGAILQREVMPTVTVKASKREHDESAIVRFLKASAPGHAFIEKAQPMPEQGVTSTFSIGRGYGLLRGMLSALGIPYTLVHPRTWQKVMFRDQPKTDTKAMSVLIAGRLWPATDWRATGRCKNAHHGLTDAALLAEYGRRLLAGQSNQPAYEYSKPIQSSESEDTETLFASMEAKS